MKRAILILTVLSFAPSLLAQENTFRLTVLAYEWTTTHKTMTFTWPGHANTFCNANGNMNGFVYGGGNISASGTASSTCSTTYTPPTNQNIDIQKPVVFILAETDTNRMVLTCMRNVAWSQCHALNPGTFLARIDHGPLEVQAVSGKGKEAWIKFNVVQQTAISRQEPPAPPAQEARAFIAAQQPAALPPAPAPVSPAPAQASLNINSTPSGADIELNGKFAGSTPSVLKVNPGPYKIVVTRNGFKPWGRQVEVGTGDSISINAELEAAQQQNPNVILVPGRGK